MWRGKSNESGGFDDNSRTDTTCTGADAANRFAKKHPDGFEIGH